VTLEQRTLTTEGGETIAYEIGTLFVPENRSDPRSRQIGIGFARLPSALAREAPPTFHLVGGPGASHLGALDPTTDAERIKQRELLGCRTFGDVVIIDQRGYSERGEVLTFTAHEPGQPLDRPVNLADRARAFVAAARRAVEAHAGKDLSGYNIFECADDVDDLRRLLGYGQIMLVGQSFGSQWSLAVMKRHPGLVARAVLSGIEPLDKVYDMPSQVFAALQRIAWEADREPMLAPFLPLGGLMEALSAVRERFARGPLQVEIAVETGGPIQVVSLGLGDFQRSLLRPAAAWPAHVLSIYHARYDDWAREVARERRRGQPDAPLIGPLIDTSLGVSLAREHRLRTDPASEFLGWWDFESYCASATVWPSPDVGDAFRAPALDQTPVVFICGDWDTATPLENMLGLLPYFPNGRALIVRRGPHAAKAVLAQSGSPVIAAVLEFLRTGDHRPLPAQVSLPPPIFAIPAFPAPRSRP
jgi:pimeloyl-ACP methyl ester carboxylesterase